MKQRWPIGGSERTGIRAPKNAAAVAAGGNKRDRERIARRSTEGSDSEKRQGELCTLFARHKNAKCLRRSSEFRRCLKNNCA